MCSGTSYAATDDVAEMIESNSRVWLTWDADSFDMGTALHCTGFGWDSCDKGGWYKQLMEKVPDIAVSSLTPCALTAFFTHQDTVAFGLGRTGV